MNFDITEAELTKLEKTKSAEEWNATCDEIKKARGGNYPPNWWAKVMMSGVAAKAKSNWSCDCGHDH